MHIIRPESRSQENMGLFPKIFAIVFFMSTQPSSFHCIVRLLAAPNEHTASLTDNRNRREVHFIVIQERWRNCEVAVPA